MAPFTNYLFKYEFKQHVKCSSALFQVSSSGCIVKVRCKKLPNAIEHWKNYTPFTRTVWELCTNMKEIAFPSSRNIHRIYSLKPAYTHSIAYIYEHFYTHLENRKVGKKSPISLANCLFPYISFSPCFSSFIVFLSFVHRINQTSQLKEIQTHKLKKSVDVSSPWSSMINSQIKDKHLQIKVGQDMN